MRPGGGKGKGAGFEREICKKLSLWISNGKREDLFWRSAMSGGRATLGHRKGKDLRYQAGDITATHPDGHVFTDYFYAECKFVNNLDLEGFFFKNTGKLNAFWCKTLVEAEKHKRHPFLVAKQNRLPTLVLVLYPDFSNREPSAVLGSVEIYLLDDLLRGKFQSYARPSHR